MFNMIIISVNAFVLFVLNITRGVRNHFQIQYHNLNGSFYYHEISNDELYDAIMDEKTVNFTFFVK